MAPDCAVCGVDATVSDACPHCGTACCPEHRRPAAHDCPGTTAGITAGWRLDLDGSDEGDVDVRTTRSTSLSTLLGRGIGLGALALLLVAVALGAVAAVGPLDDGLDPGGVETQVVAETNEARLAAGVGDVESDDALAAVARAHSRDMRDRGFVGHTNPDGADHEDRVRAAGIDCLPGENVYQAPRGTLADGEGALADHVVRSWLDSPGHRRTLLRERYERQGVGVAIGEDAVYVTQVFC